MTPRIVLDTNVLVAALRSQQGASFKVLSLVGLGRFSLHLSVPLVLEYEEVLLRYEKDLTVTSEDIKDLLDYLWAVALPQDIFFLWRPFLKDADDDMVLELAANASCEVIVSFNVKDFGGSEQFGVEALTPREFLVRIGELS